MKIKTALLIIILPLFTFAKPTAFQVIKNGEQIMRGNNSYSRIIMKVEKPHFRRTMAMDGWDSKKNNRFFIRILKPKKDKGTTFLKIKKIMWQYIPKIGREIKIESSLMHDSWMGSDFSNDDLMKQSSIVNDFVHTFLESDKIHLYKILLTPKPKAPVIWKKIIITVRKKDALPTKYEYYDAKQRLRKIMLLGQIKKMDGRKLPTLLVMGTLKDGKVKSKTTLKYLDMKFNQQFSSFTFSKANLRR